VKKILLTTTALHQPWNEGDWDMTDGNTHAINKHLNDQEDWDALQEVTTELEQAEARIEELEAKLARVTEALESVRSFTRDLGFYADQGHTLAPALLKACDTLKELKGETDE
jgi:chromosome condensin MukBEF ATPase and DNA-binding subunit MukB